MTTKAKNRKNKTIVSIEINRINANRVFAHPPCAIPPDDTKIWDFEAEGEVNYKDDTSETLYFARFEDTDPEFPNGWQVFTKSVSDIVKAKEEFDDYKIAEYSTNSEAFESPYGNVLRQLTALFAIMVIFPEFYTPVAQKRKTSVWTPTKFGELSWECHHDTDLVVVQGKNEGDLERIIDSLSLEERKLCTLKKKRNSGALSQVEMPESVFFPKVF